MSRDVWNARRSPTEEAHYESWFLRGNHPCLPQAFWIRYTLFVASDGRPSLGELWFIYFDRANANTVAKKLELPFGQCQFDRDKLGVSIGTATLHDGELRGEIDDVRWNLTYEGSKPPVLLLPKSTYARAFPKAKSVVPLPLASFRGSIQIGQEVIEIDRWIGSQNHNWGPAHTDRYAWCQVAGFDDEPDAFFECVTAKVKIGPFSTPWVSLAVLKIAEQSYSLNSLIRGAWAPAHVAPGDWEFTLKRGDLEIHASICASIEDYVALRYYNPPGGAKTCLNSKTARCKVEFRTNGTARILSTRHRAAFELLVDPKDSPLQPRI